MSLSRSICKIQTHVMKSVSCYISIIYYEYCTSWLSIISCYTLLKQTFIYVCHCITNNIHLFSRTEQNIIYSVNLYSVYCLNKQRNWWHIQKKSNRHVNTVACETVNTLSNKHKNQTIHRNKHSTTFGCIDLPKRTQKEPKRTQKEPKRTQKEHKRRF